MDIEKVIENVVEEPQDYFIVGNKEFRTEEEAQAFLAKAEKELEMTYFQVTYSPDLTEGRGYYKQMIIATSSPLGINLVYEFLQSLLGSAMAWVQGCAPMPNYSVSDGKKFEHYMSLEKFLNDTYSSLGSFSYQKRQLIILDENPRELYVVQKALEVKESPEFKR